MTILRGITVLDLTHYAAGYCGMLLVDLGADVIKVEPPEGEGGRRVTPQVAGESLFFIPWNRNKRGITLNLRLPRGRQTCRDLVGRADVLVESFTPGTMADWGLDSATLRNLNPRLVYVSVTGFGQTGPCARRPAFEMTAEAMSGAMFRNGFPDAPPTLIGIAVTAYAAGCYAALGTLAALRHRDQTGEGQVVDIGMMDSAISLLESAPAEYRLTGQVPPRTGNRRRVTAPTNVYRVADGYIYLAASTQAQWERLAATMGRESLLADARFATNPHRVANAEALDTYVEAWLAPLSTVDAVAALDAASVPCGAVQDMPEVLADPQVRARQMIVEIDHPVLGAVPVAGNPIKMSGEAPAEFSAPPQLGEHNADVYGSLLGYGENDLTVLRRDGVI